MACGGWEPGQGMEPARLEARLRASVDADRHYAQENAAKIRAINTAPTYDEFRQIVLGAHLKPLDKGDKKGMSRPSIWNSIASSGNKKGSRPVSHQDVENCVYPMDCQYDIANPPSTSEGLVQLWERLDLADRLDFLRSLKPTALEQLAGGLVAGGMLGDAITTLLAFTPSVNDVVMVVNFLHDLSMSKRFSLSVTLVCGEERWAWGRLMEKLQLALSERPQDLAELNVTEWTLAQLKLKFNL
ncbi:unnamed protein product, partial [Meganyctiphanes norvegica]|uniref:Coiled-coil domain-containing protein 103 n=1 Tax=Meganyctiphanes norvegica TaxID=48144 RepID=A0AAV2RYY9_MEGNR